MPRVVSVDERTIATIVKEALRLESLAPSLPGELPDSRTVTKLGGLSLEDIDAGEVRLKSLWEDRPAALIFLRHYG
jgi:hypothetical protein